MNGFSCLIWIWIYRYIYKHISNSDCKNDLNCMLENESEKILRSEVYKSVQYIIFEIHTYKALKKDTRNEP